MYRNYGYVDGFRKYQEIVQWKLTTFSKELHFPTLDTDMTSSNKVMLHA